MPVCPQEPYQVVRPILLGEQGVIYFLSDHPCSARQLGHQVRTQMLAAPSSRSLEDQANSTNVVGKGGYVPIPAALQILVFLSHDDQKDVLLIFDVSGTDCSPQWSDTARHKL